jgi:extracellular factor (EF) 3-hydroxypalmitic acid methyl ester biosynthesis protein
MERIAIMSVVSKKATQLAEVPVPQSKADETPVRPGLRYRENRIVIPDGVRCVLKWRDYYGQEVVAQVLDVSRYGCRAVLPKDSESNRLFTKIKRAEIEVDSAIAYKGALTFVNERQEENGSISMGASFEQGGCDLDAFAAATGHQINLDSDLQRFQILSENVKPEFKILAADLNAILQEIKLKLEREESRVAEAAHSENYRARLEERVINVAMSIYRPILQNYLTRFQEISNGLGLDEETLHKQYFRLNFQSLIRGTPFVDRGITKPLGYSGDYGMMVMLYEYADQGDTLFTRFFHRFVCSEPAAVANRNRVGFLSDILMEGYEKALKRGDKIFSVASIACGPAREIFEFLTCGAIDPKLPIKLVLIDSEEHALNYAHNRLKELGLPQKQVEMIFLKEDAVTGILKGKEFVSWLKSSNFIISAGLFDYLTERVAQRMIGELFHHLAPEGQLLIGNISKRSPDVFAMDYFMDWRLILRDEPDLLRLVNPEITSGRGGVADVISESLGLNLFLRLKREGSK